VKPPLSAFLGKTAVLASALCFYFSTVVIRWSRAEVTIDPAYFAFFRFVLGFLIVCAVMAVGRRPPRPRNYHLLVGRTVTNCAAVYCFYMAVIRSSVAEANILNMTYPVFVAMLSWVLLRSQRDRLATVMVPVAFAGIWLIVAPGDLRINPGSLWGLASGTCASAAILYLNVSRQHHDVNTILFFMFGLGALITLAAFHDRFFLPDARTWYYLFLCGGFGIAGQFLITVGFRYVTAVEGSIISSMRIFLAALLGPLVAGEAPLTGAGWLGALLLFAANAVLAMRRSRMPSGGGP
jgi:drug/metabolite transporter (DMT)-like permease